MKYFLYLLPLLLTACLKLAQRPDWVDGSSQAYPQQQYLSASGSAVQAEEAKSRALANLARIFEVQIDDSSSDYTGITLRQEDEQQQRLQTQTVVRYVDAYTYKLLEGAEIAEMWFDESSGQHYALALVSRAHLTTRLHADIRAADGAVDDALKHAAGTHDLLLRVHHLYRAWQFQGERDALQKDLRIVDLQGRGMPAPWSVSALAQRLAEGLYELKVAVVIESDADDGLRDALAAGLAAAGMIPVSEDAQYHLHVALDVEDVGRREGWYWYRGALEIRLLEVHNQKLRGMQRWPLKVSGQTPAQAQIRLRSEVLRLLQVELKTTMVNFAAEE